MLVRGGYRDEYVDELDRIIGHLVVDVSDLSDTTPIVRVQSCLSVPPDSAKTNRHRAVCAVEIAPPDNPTRLDLKWCCRSVQDG